MNPEDGGTMSLRNISIRLQDYHSPDNLLNYEERDSNSLLFPVRYRVKITFLSNSGEW
jgi:hypothetical protein